jgi:hypothetical protein
MRTALAVVLMVLGCASQKPAQTRLAMNDVPYSSPGQARPKGVMRCHMERDTGSNFMEKVCVYEDKAGAEDKTLDDGMIKAQQRALQHVMPDCNGSNTSGCPAMPHTR